MFTGGSAPRGLGQTMIHPMEAREYRLSKFLASSHDHCADITSDFQLGKYLQQG